MTLSSTLRSAEVYRLLSEQMTRSENRAATWGFIETNFDALLEKVPEHHAGAMPGLGANFCSEEEATRVAQFFAPRIAKLEGGPRNLEGALEAIRLCAASKQRHTGEAAAAFK